MKISIENLKESNDFLNILIDNIGSALFIVDQNLRIHNVNKTFTVLFGKNEKEVEMSLCGNAIGCFFAVEEDKDCGKTSKCHLCKLRNNVTKAFTNKEDYFKDFFNRYFYINNSKEQKFFKFITKDIYFNENEMVIIIVDDITETEIQKQEIINQKNIIDYKSKKITDSIKYAQNIQKTIFPDECNFRRTFSESFIILLPKDMVSGDFCIFEEKPDKVFIAAIDCTGHGVPGAFMSIFAYNIIKQAINEKKLDTPSEILYFLNKTLFEIFHSENFDISVKDGLDIAFCVFDKNERKINYSGANIQLVIIKNNQLIEIKPDEWFLGVQYLPEKNIFTDKKINLDKDDVLYIFSDGFYDQFGGTNRKKYMNKRFKEFLFKIHKEKMKDQKKLLIEEFNNWKNNNEQIDDVLIIGFKI